MTEVESEALPAPDSHKQRTPPKLKRGVRRTKKGSRNTMPVLTKLTAEEVDALKTRKEDADSLAPYREFIGELQLGDWGTLTPDAAAGENRRTVKRRLTVAARLSGYGIRYHQGAKAAEDESIRFQIRKPVANGHRPVKAAEAVA